MRAKLILLFIFKYYKSLVHRIVVSLKLRKHRHHVILRPHQHQQRLPGKQDQVKSRMLEMAEAEHAAKMKMYKLKKDILTMKKRKLEESVSNNNEVNRPSKSNKTSCEWRPF